MQKDPFIKTVLQSICEENSEALTQEATLRPSVQHGQNMPPAASWQESLSYIFAYELVDNRDMLVKELGDTLLKMRNVSAAIVCYIISWSINDVLELWMQRAMFQISKREKTREQALFELFQRFILFKLATESVNDKRRMEFDSNEIYNAVLVEVS